MVFVIFCRLFLAIQLRPFFFDSVLDAIRIPFDGSAFSSIMNRHLVFILLTAYDINPFFCWEIICFFCIVNLLRQLVQFFERAAVCDGFHFIPRKVQIIQYKIFQASSVCFITSVAIVCRCCCMCIRCKYIGGQLLHRTFYFCKKFLPIRIFRSILYRLCIYRLFYQLTREFVRAFLLILLAILIVNKVSPIEIGCFRHTTAVNLVYTSMIIERMLSTISYGPRHAFHCILPCGCVMCGTKNISWFPQLVFQLRYLAQFPYIEKAMKILLFAIFLLRFGSCFGACLACLAFLRLHLLDFAQCIREEALCRQALIVCELPVPPFLVRFGHKVLELLTCVRQVDLALLEVVHDALCLLLVGKDSRAVLCVLICHTGRIGVLDIARRFALRLCFCRRFLHFILHGKVVRRNLLRVVLRLLTGTEDRAARHTADNILHRLCVDIIHHFTYEHRISIGTNWKAKLLRVL